MRHRKSRDEDACWGVQLCNLQFLSALAPSLTASFALRPKESALLANRIRSGSPSQGRDLAHRPHDLGYDFNRKNAGPLAVVAFLTNMGLFQGQSQDFKEELNAIARAADKARRQLEAAEEEDIV